MAIVDVIKYEGGPDVLAWKYPSNELGTWTQVIVGETQEAILFKGGQALDLLGPGRHTLDTANIPLLNKIINLPFGGKSPFKAEIWYVNKITNLDIRWGTPTPIQLQDPKYGIAVPVTAFGQFGVKVVDSRQFLLSLVGTLSSFTVDDLKRYFKGIYISNIKSLISQCLVQHNIGILQINAHLEEIAEYLQKSISAKFAKYGLELVNFTINDISVDENNPEYTKLREALSKRAEMDVVGYTYEQERSFDVMDKMAENVGHGQSGGMMDLGLGAGIGFGVGGNLGEKFNQMGNKLKFDKDKGADHDQPAQYSLHLLRPTHRWHHLYRTTHRPHPQLRFYPFRHPALHRASLHAYHYLRPHRPDHLSVQPARC